MKPSTALGQYLRARRELVRPEEAGVPKSGRRRVPGLRREELAMLAGISADYYLRLEQGRDKHPSEQVIDALARALRLDEGATAHLRALARPTPTKGRLAERERAPASIERLIASWPHTPAFVWGRHMDILAANALVTAISPVFSPGVNLVRATFLDPEVRRLVGDWEDAAQSTVARLRARADAFGGTDRTHAATTHGKEGVRAVSCPSESQEQETSGYPYAAVATYAVRRA